MPPKSKPRKVSRAPRVPSKDHNASPPQQSKFKEKIESAMPPPPVPPKAVVILEPEINALVHSFKNAVVRTGQIYSFHADSQRLGISRYAPYPPRSLTDSLGREIERFDQIFDVMDSRLSRAIAVLQRDLAREHRRALETENAAIATRTRSKSTSQSPMTCKVPLPLLDTDIVMAPPPPPPQPPQVSPPLGSAHPTRRGSAISLSSLHRPPFPLKLDLSSSSLRMSAEEAALFSQALPSPVSLAPKSARPSAQTEMDLMAAFASATASSSSQHVHIDLTTDDDATRPGLDSSLGSSADKPIELDLDSIDMEMSTMTDLFADGAETGSSGGMEGIFSPISPDGSASNSTKESKDGELAMKILGSLPVDNVDHGNDECVFATSDANSMQASSLGAQSAPGNAVPSPNAILVSFADSQTNGTSPQLASGDGNFDLSALDLSHFDRSFFQPSDINLMDMETLLDMGQNKSTL